MFFIGSPQFSRLYFNYLSKTKSRVMDCKNLVIHLNNDTKVAHSGCNLKLKDS